MKHHFLIIVLSTYATQIKNKWELRKRLPLFKDLIVTPSLNCIVFFCEIGFKLEKKLRRSP